MVSFSFYVPLFWCTVSSWSRFGSDIKRMSAYTHSNAHHAQHLQTNTKRCKHLTMVNQNHLLSPEQDLIQRFYTASNYRV